MSRLPPGLARRIDRLAVRAHAFHRLAHHPLCDRYAGEVVRLGRRTRVCRGCLLLAVGAAAGALAGALLPLGLLAGGPAAAAGWLLLLVLLAAWALSPRGGRPRPRLLTRFLPMALAAALALAGLRAAAAGGLTLTVLSAGVTGAGVALYRRRGPDRAACLGCPQGPPGPGCDGYRPVARRERAFSRLVGRWLRAARL